MSRCPHGLTVPCDACEDAIRQDERERIAKALDERIHRLEAKADHEYRRGNPNFGDNYTDDAITLRDAVREIFPGRAVPRGGG